MTRACVLTPPGRGAIAVVEVIGSDASRAVDKHFRGISSRPIGEEPLDRVLFGRWGGLSGEEVVVVRTGPDAFEIHCHGGVAAVDAVLAALKRFSTSIVETPTRPSSLSEDARRVLANAPTERVAGILLDQAAGALETAIKAAKIALAQERPADTLAIIKKLLSRRRLGRHLTRPWSVVLAGPPNVGKSSLINALVGFDRAVVYDQAGTTRDVVTALTAIDGWPVELADTAGLRRSDDPLEQAGIQLTETEIGNADVVVCVRDARSAPDISLVNRSTSPTVLVANKSDLAPSGELSEGEIATIAPGGEGIDELVSAIGQALGVPPLEPGDPIPFREWHFDSLAAAQRAIESGRESDAIEPLTALLACDYAD